MEQQYIDIFGLAYFKDKLYQTMEQILPDQTINNPIGNGMYESCIAFNSVPLGSFGSLPNIPQSVVSIDPKKTLLLIAAADGSYYIINNVGKHIIYRNSQISQMSLFLSDGIEFYCNTNIVVNGYITFQHT